ncbi:MAG: hypothetical protein ABID38_07565 [Candidatus Diapherotrites archaeon]
MHVTDSHFSTEINLPPPGKRLSVKKRKLGLPTDLEDFIEKNPESFSDHDLEKYEELNVRFEKDIKPSLKKYRQRMNENTKRGSRNGRRKGALGGALGGLALGTGLAVSSIPRRVGQSRKKTVGKTRRGKRK